MQQILWAEVIIKAAIGALLIVAPLTSSSILGLARPNTGFWPRLCAGVLFGIAAGTWLGIAFPNVHGAIGPGGLIPINLAAASMLIGPLILGARGAIATGQRHGRPVRNHPSRLCISRNRTSVSQAFTTCV